MIAALTILSYLFVFASGFLFFWIIQTLLPLRQNRFLKLAAMLACFNIVDVVIYSNDLTNMLGYLIGFFIYLLLCHSSRLIEKLSILLVFYTSVLAVNYLMLDIGSRIFFGITKAPPTGPRNAQEHLLSTVIYTLGLLFRLLFWLAAWLSTRRYLKSINLRLQVRMWLLVDILILAPFVAVFTVIYFMPNNPAIMYPICIVSIISSFGCIYLASYICQSVILKYRTQELELKHSYYEEKLKEEERIRRIYHDLKNHLLLLRANTGNMQDNQKSIQELQAQIEGYENYYHTGNDYLDILLRDKAKTAQENQIDFSALVHFTGSAFIAPLDISTIFGNALDNAIEACLLLPPQMRLITIKADRIRNILLIRIENLIDQNHPPTGRTTKADDYSHGFGLSNIKSAVMKYDGECVCKVVNNKFQLKIMIPVQTEF